MEWLLNRVRVRGASASEHDPRLLAFARGTAAGALVGAAIAGTGIWRHFRGGHAGDEPKFKRSRQTRVSRSHDQ
jgi:hypothetical protein